MTTVDGLFGAGDTVGGSAHKFSSGSFTEGRLAAKAAVKYIEEQKAKDIKVSDKQCEEFKEAIYKPLENYTVGRNEITGGTVSPSYILPIQGLQRLQKIMDEYVGGISFNYMTNENLLKKGLELLNWLQEDLENIGAKDYHQLMRAWELKHRTLTSQCVTEHTLFREETRWPGYYYRGDHMKLDDDNWHCLTVSRRDPKTGKFSMEKKPVYHIIDEKKKKSFVSSSNKNVELTGPGEDILSTWPNNAYDFKTGTSMASPHAAAVAALGLGGIEQQQIGIHLDGFGIEHELLGHCRRSLVLLAVAFVIVAGVVLAVVLRRIVLLLAGSLRRRWWVLLLFVALILRRWRRLLILRRRRFHLLVRRRHL